MRNRIRRSIENLMSKNVKFFVLSSSTLDYREVRLFKTKLAGAGLLLGALTVGLIMIFNHFSSDILGLGYERMSMVFTENRILKEQIQELSQKMRGVQHALEKVSERGNELRLMVDLSKIDDDTRAAASGGAKHEVEFAFLSGKAADILTESQGLIDQLSRQVKLQQASYEEIYHRYTYNKDFFAHLPAIKPMVGPYSIHGFGMRIHPVLRVYRMHEGIDILNDAGMSVYATGDGTIQFAGRTQGGYGAVVEISHGYGYSSLFAHLSKVLVRPGQAVKRGDLIALSGRSGLVSGPHLHYEVRYNGRQQNPVDYFFDDVDAAHYRTLLADTK